MRGASRSRVRPLHGPSRSPRNAILLCIGVCLLMYLFGPALLSGRARCTYISAPHFDGDGVFSQWQLWDHKTIGHPTGVSVLYVTRLLTSASACAEGVIASHRSKLSIVHVSARGGSQNARTEELFTENSHLALGDAVAHEENVFALLFFSSPIHRLAEPYTLLRLKDDGTDVNRISLPSAERHLLLALEDGPLLLSYSTGCVTYVFALQLDKQRTISLSLPSSARIGDVVRAGHGREAFVLQGSNCNSGLDEWLLCSLDSAASTSCTRIDLAPSSVVHYYDEDENRLVFSGRVNSNSAVACWSSSPKGVRTPTEVEDSNYARLCECGRFCVSPAHLGVEVRVYVAQRYGFSYDAAKIPVTVPPALGWPGEQFPPVALASHLVQGPHGDEYIRVWRGVRRVPTTGALTQVISVESRGSDVVALQTPLIPFPLPHFPPLMPGEKAHCFATRQFTHIASPPIASLALTFVGGPTPFVRELLPMLRDLRIRATFFVRGEQVMLYPDLLLQIVMDGHEVGAEAMHAGVFVGMSRSDVERDIAAVLGYVAGVTGTRPCLIRPPSGRSSKEVESAFELFALSSSYATATLSADSSLSTALQKSLEYWPALAFPYREQCTENCRGAVVELREAAVRDTDSVLSTLRGALEELRASKNVRFVRITGEQFPAYAEPSD